MKSIVSAFPALFTVNEVAKLFRLTEAAVRRMIRAKNLPAIRLGKEYRIPAQAVENILHPLSEQNLKDAGFGLWRAKETEEGAKWVRKHRDQDKRSLEELLQDLKTA